MEYPCIYADEHPDGGYWPNGKPPENPPDDPLGDYRKRMAPENQMSDEVASEAGPVSN